MRDSDLHWLAGLLEGEGSFMKPAPSAPNQIIISLQMTDEDIVARVASLAGLRYKKQRNPRPGHWKDVYQLQIRGGKAVSLMAVLKPLMGSRRQGQITRALEAYDPSLVVRHSLPGANELRKLLKNNTTRELGERFGCSRQTISRRSKCS